MEKVIIARLYLASIFQKKFLMIVDVYFISILEKNILTIAANNKYNTNCGSNRLAAVRYALIQDTSNCFICP